MDTRASRAYAPPWYRTLTHAFHAHTCTRIRIKRLVHTDTFALIVFSNQHETNGIVGLSGNHI